MKLFIAEQCLESTNDQSLPSFSDYEGGGDEISRFHQAIIPSYRFQCCGNVTEWRVDVHPGGGRDDEEYTLNLQVWRPSPTLSSSISGNYNLIGNNRFTSISLTGGAVRVTPSPQDYIQFRPGDVLGFYVEEARDDSRGVVVLTEDSYTNEMVWYATISKSQILGCPVSVGRTGKLNRMLRGAPVIEIDTCKTLLLRNSQTVSVYIYDFSYNFALLQQHMTVLGQFPPLHHVLVPPLRLPQLFILRMLLLPFQLKPHHYPYLTLSDYIYIPLLL